MLSGTADEAREGYAQACAALGGRAKLAEESAACWVCQHSTHSHYQTSDGFSGCIETASAPLTFSAAWEGQYGASKFIGGQGGCLCPGYRQGLLPWSLTSNLESLAAHDEELCPDCMDPLVRHGVEHAWDPAGCWCCPCERATLPEFSVIAVDLGGAEVSVLSDIQRAAALGTEIAVGRAGKLRLEAAQDGMFVLSADTAGGLALVADLTGPELDVIGSGVAGDGYAEVPLLMLGCPDGDDCFCDPGRALLLTIVVG